MPKIIQILIGFFVTLLAGAWGLSQMWQGESHIRFEASQLTDLATFEHMVDAGLKPYFWGMGVIFVVVALALIWIDGQNDVSSLTGESKDA